MPGRHVSPCDKARAPGRTHCVNLAFCVTSRFPLIMYSRCACCFLPSRVCFVLFSTISCVLRMTPVLACSTASILACSTAREALNPLIKCCYCCTFGRPSTATFGRDTTTLKIANRGSGTCLFPMYLERDGGIGETKVALPTLALPSATDLHVCYRGSFCFCTVCFVPAPCWVAHSSAA